MKKKSYWLLLVGVLFLVGATVSSCAKKEEVPLNTGQRPDTDDSGNNEEPSDENEEPSESEGLNLVDSLQAYLEGSNYYLIYLDQTIADEIESQVEKDYRINKAESESKFLYFSDSFKEVDSEGPNPFGLEDKGWMSIQVNGDAAVTWASGSMENTVPTDFTGITDDYVLHFAIKSKEETVSYLLRAGFGTNNGDNADDIGAKILLGEDENSYANFPRDGEWYHFEIPVSELKVLNPKFNFANILVENAHLFDFSIPGTPDGDTPLDIGAVFYYLPK